ncbi:hypothetical protein ACFVKB_39100 [Rhodococcus sp. NPDC127530]|uniref:hypothetical protein n=1 Tax=unclassified Rhodococcus (in: high G+C Gram-positive bacteria) TaxID=192944 RepID=UPI0036306CE7
MSCLDRVEVYMHREIVSERTTSTADKFPHPACAVAGLTEHDVILRVILDSVLGLRRRNIRCIDNELRHETHFRYCSANSLHIPFFRVLRGMQDVYSSHTLRQSCGALRQSPDHRRGKSTWCEHAPPTRLIELGRDIVYSRTHAAVPRSTPPARTSKLDPRPHHRRAQPIRITLEDKRTQMLQGPKHPARSVWAEKQLHLDEEPRHQRRNRHKRTTNGKGELPGGARRNRHHPNTTTHTAGAAQLTQYSTGGGTEPNEVSEPGGYRASKRTFHPSLRQAIRPRHRTCNSAES